MIERKDISKYPKYLYPFRRRVEILAALYAGGFGMFVWAQELTGQAAPIHWLGLSSEGQLMLAQVMTVCALIHALGIRINGHWQYSPALRLIGMGVHACIFLWVALQGSGTSASYTYSWIASAMIYGAYSSARDLGFSLGWDGRWKLH